MFFVFEKIVFGMAALRILSSSIEFTAALLMLRFNNVETAFKINALLAVVGPTVMITVTSLGLVGLAGKASPQGLAAILLGIALILIGVNRL
ncbi:MAG: YqhV family protein [Peptococcaceae bacterium]|nr:YqhV family protein [Peptococcaceae bacterium]